MNHRPGSIEAAKGLEFKACLGHDLDTKTFSHLPHMASSHVNGTILGFLAHGCFEDKINEQEMIKVVITSLMGALAPLTKATLT